MFQNLIVAASAVNGKVVSTLEIGKNGMATNWFTDNSWTVRLYLNDSAHPHICVCHTGGAPDIEWMGAGRLSHTAQLPGRPCMEDDAPSVSRAGDGDSVFIIWKNVEFGPCLHHVVVV